VIVPLARLGKGLSIDHRDKITPLFRQPDRVERLAQRGGKHRCTIYAAKADWVCEQLELAWDALRGQTIASRRSGGH
jgi:hypothetical protein